MSWVFEKNNAETSLKSFIDKHYPNTYTVVLSQNEENALVTKHTFYIQQENILNLFRMFQRHRKQYQTPGDKWLVVFFAQHHPVSKAYNRLIRDPNVDIIVVSDKKSVLHDARLTLVDDGFNEVASPTTSSSWWSRWW
jgi:hypothetical protein